MAADAPAANGAAKEAPKGKEDGKKKAAAKVVELSEEDAQLKESLELCVVRSADSDPGVAKLALETLLKEIRTATRRGATAVAAAPRAADATQTASGTSFLYREGPQRPATAR